MWEASKRGVCGVGLLLLFQLAQAQMLRDPTRPPGSTASSHHGGLVVTSILIAKDRRLATVNGKILAVGDEIMGARVAGIQPNLVQFRIERGELVSVPLVGP